ncbi:GTPase IMAP family member 8-like [Trichomycterus rosablanca]|uniref:GTPase IMAP family member 8-like n=1 Tax=Trichomycterus rosablanca TaxID=2290929 RepID=UPI002F360509
MESTGYDSDSSTDDTMLDSEWNYGASGGASFLPELRILLVGNSDSEPSSAGNVILGRDEFDSQTVQSVRRQAVVAGMKIAVVAAPGWWKSRPVDESTELLKQELVLSLRLCPPGPHAVLLVIDGDSNFEEKDKKILEGHLCLLGENVWSHSVVVFLFDESLGDMTVEQHIESGGKAVQWLVEKCENRYHVLYKDEKDVDLSEVPELLEKIEVMVISNDGRPYEIDSALLLEMERSRSVEKERATERRMRLQNQRQQLRSRMDKNKPLSEVNIVMLGYRNSGRSSVGNTILGKKEFDLDRATQCVMRQGDVAGRKITVVEVPGWFSNKPVEDSTELLKKEIILSVSLCPPGPHAVLLAVSLKFDFKEIDRSVVEGYVMLFGEAVWNHAIVVFSVGDWLGDTPIEEFIECEGKALQWLVEKCGNRYHVLNNGDRADKAQVTELLDVIEEMVAGLDGRHFDAGRNILRELEERRTCEKRASERMMKVQRQRQDIRSRTDVSLHLSEVRMVLLGYINSGRSSAGNTVLCKDAFDLSKTTQCVRRQGDVAGRQITVVEAPGWWSDRTVEKSTELLKQDIVLSVSLCPPGPHAVLLVVSLKFDFKETDRKVLEGHVLLLGEGVWKQACVLFTGGDYLGNRTIEQYIECEGKALQWLVEKCGNRYHVLDNEDREDDAQVRELLEKIEEMVADNGGCCFEMDRKILQEVEDKRRADEERAKQRMKKVQKQRETAKSYLDLRRRRPAGLIIVGNDRLNKRSQGLSCVDENEGLLTNEREARSSSPTPSYLSMKSDWSMDIPPTLNWAPSVSAHREDPEVVSGKCSVCKEVPRDPVPIPCGHTYCGRCIETRRSQPGPAGGCPECSDAASASSSPACFGHVTCDFCTETKSRAVKSCLTCAASYCESHVMQHYTVPALRGHVLVDATEDLEKRRCPIHHRALEVFCTTDQTQICTLCVLFQHRGHDVKFQPVAEMMEGAVKEPVRAAEPSRKVNKFVSLCFLCVVGIGGFIYYTVMRGHRNLPNQL